MGKLHKEIGQLIVQSAEDPEKSDSQVIQVMPSSSHRRVLKVPLGSGQVICCPRSESEWRGPWAAAQRRSSGWAR